MECARYGFRIDRKTSIGCFTKNGHDMVVIEDIGLDGKKKFQKYNGYKGILMDHYLGLNSPGTIVPSGDIPYLKGC